MRINKKLVIAGSVAGVIALGAGTAFAYWTTSGSGTGTGAAATTAKTVTVVQDTVLPALYPVADLDAGASIEGHFTTASASAVQISSLIASVDSVTPLEGMTCSASNFAVTSTNLLSGPTMVATNGSTTWTGAKVALINSTSDNQDGCKGATVHLAYTAS